MFLQRQLARLALAISCIIVLRVSANAAELPGTQFNVAGWEGAAYSTNSGEFSHCAMSATYNSGITLIFALNPKIWEMRLYNANWHLTTGQEYPVSYWVDNTTPRQASAGATSTNTVAIELPLTASEFNLFRYGNRVTIVAASQNFQFNLTGTSSALYALGACTDQQTTLASSNPFAAQNPFTSGTSSQLPDSGRATLQAEATALAANLLSQAGVQFTLVPPDKIPPELKNYLAVWVSPNATAGAINIVLPGAGVSASAQSSAIIADDSRGCTGRFASGTVPDTENTSIFTACEGKDTSYVFYQIVARKAGGLYIIATGSTNSDATPARQTDTAIRTAVYQAISN